MKKVENLRTLIILFYGNAILAMQVSYNTPTYKEGVVKINQDEILQILIDNGKYDELKKRYSRLKSKCLQKHHSKRNTYYGMEIHKDWLNKAPDRRFTIRRGIRIGLGNFILWSIENDFEIGLTLDRINNDLGYLPSNCRWITMEAQVFNRKPIQKNNTSGYRGVVKNKSGRYMADVFQQGKKVRVGTFNSSIEAAIARNKFIEDNNLPIVKNIIKE